MNIQETILDKIKELRAQRYNSKEIAKMTKIQQFLIEDLSGERDIKTQKQESIPNQKSARNKPRISHLTLITTFINTNI